MRPADMINQNRQIMCRTFSRRIPIGVFCEPRETCRLALTTLTSGQLRENWDDFKAYK